MYLHEPVQGLNLNRRSISGLEPVTPVTVHTIKKNTEDLVVASKDIGLEVNDDKTKYMVMSRDQNAGRSHDIKIDNSSFEVVVKIRYFGTNLTNQSSIQQENKCRLK
jgi:hypothetical protein